MELKIQYNKTFIQQLQRQLSIREKALPTLKSKETALRLEVRNIKRKLKDIEEQRDAQWKEMMHIGILWNEFGNLIKVKEVNTTLKNIAGVKVPTLSHLEFEVAAFNYFTQPAWIPTGIETLKSYLQLEVESEITNKQFEILANARKKTTQKVNLYEKVQIPAYQEGIRKIKRYLEDKENLSKAAQKIIKNRTERKEVRHDS